MSRLRFLIVSATVFALAATTPASAQLFGGRRQDEAIAALQQQVAALTQRLDGSPGQPGLAPQLETARGELERARQRIDDLEESLRSLNGTVEGLTSELSQSRQQRDAVTEQNRELSERMQRLEAQLTQVQAALAAPPTRPADPPVDPQDPGDEGADPPPAPAADTADAAWAQARILLRDGDYAAAGEAYQGFAQRWPRDPRVQEASHQLGETRFLREDWQGAAAAYAASLRGWPRAPWAAESALKLAQSLARLDRSAEGCQAVAEFQRRYAAGASERGRSRAQAIARELSCQT